MGVSYDVLVVPVESDVRFTNSSVNLSLLYNTAYNVTVEAISLCGQKMNTTLTKLNYSESNIIML